MKTLGKWALAVLVVLLLGFTALTFWMSHQQSAPAKSQQHTPQMTPDSPAATASHRHVPLTAEIPVLLPTQARPPVGINVNELHYEDASFPFVDLFRQADPFQNNTLELEQAEQVEYDAQGWPVRLNGAEAGTKFLGKIPAAALAEGNYSVWYDGVGELRYGHDVEVVSREPGHELIRFNPASDDRPDEIDASLVITRTDESDPLRNIRILPPGGICQNNPYVRVQGVDDCAADTRYLAFADYYPSILFTRSIWTSSRISA
ncbi:MAG: hypothetical protein R3E95_22350 [Thiolinea sp.]